MSEIKQNNICCSTPQVNEKIYIFPYLCNSCGICAEVCPFGLPRQGLNKKYEISRSDLCTECSACQRNCLEQAIIMQEVEGCGCLWNVISKRKNKAKSNTGNCGCDCSC
jgi:ferredoxin